MRVLENRVEQGYHRLNAQRAATRALRDAIDGTRKERLATAELQRKLAQQLSAARARAADLLRSAHSARVARDKARTRPIHPCGLLVNVEMWYPSLSLMSRYGPLSQADLVTS